MPGLRTTLSLVSTALMVPSVLAGGMDARWVEIANNHAGDSVPDYSAAVLGDDPVLASTPARTFDLMVSTTSPVRWCSAEFQTTLTGAQSFYVSPTGSMRDPKQATWSTQPANQYSTFLCVFDFGPVNNSYSEGGWLLGKAQYPVESGVGTAILASTQIDAAWGFLNPVVGSATVARVTVLNSFSGGITIAGRVGTANNVANQDLTFTSNHFRMAPLAMALNADATGDGSVDTEDFNILAAHFGQTGILPVASGNFNGDTAVDSVDLNVLINQFGRHPNPAPVGGAVPEPASAAVLAGIILMGARRRSSALR